ncbi:MAG: hypothetical protein U0325_20005 [Polyangiales bacterium]
MHPRPLRAALAVVVALSPAAAYAQQPPAPPAETPSPPLAPPDLPPAASTPDAGVALPPPPPPDPATPVVATPGANPATPPAPPTTQGPLTAVIDAAPLGVDPAAARFVTETLRTRVAELGFRVIATEEMYAAAARLQLPFPVPAEGIYELERVLQAPVAVHAEVRAARGQYIVRVRVRVAVEAQERVREITATQFQLAEALRNAMPELLVPPRPEAVAAQPVPTPPAVVAAPATPPRRRAVRAHPRRFELGLGVIGAFGPGQDPFANALVMVRGRWFPLDRFGISASVSYANLRGRDERVSNVLMLAGVETSVDLVPSARVFIPLRFEAGYLPNNGPVFRLTAGVAFNLTRRIRMEIDVLSPTVWVLPETSPVTLDLAAHVSFAL